MTVAAIVVDVIMPIGAVVLILRAVTIAVIIVLIAQASVQTMLLELFVDLVIKSFFSGLFVEQKNK